MKRSLVGWLILFVFSCGTTWSPKQKQVTESKAQDATSVAEARVLVDHETAVLTRIASGPKDKEHLDAAAVGLATVELGSDPKGEIRRRQRLMSTLTEPDRATVREYAEARTATLQQQFKPIAAMVADSRGDRVKQWCNNYHGRADTDHHCTGVVNWCWDVCILQDTTKKHFEGPYTCGVCLVFNF